MSHKTLHEVTSSKLPISNVFILVSRRSSTLSSSSLLDVPDFCLPPPSRCPRVVFKFKFPEPEPVSVQVASRRLRFTSGADTDHRRSDMEICTPAIKDLPSSMEITTPAVARCSVRDSQPFGMELCTPAVKTLPPKMECCSPAVQHLPSSMELCTPAIKQHSSSMEMVTPAIRQLPSSMELCTPAVNYLPSSMDLCTPANNNIVSSMELCTPSVTPHFNGLQHDKRVTVVQEDSFDLKTPEISNLSLESPNKKSKTSHTKEDLKDSGISSPELIRRETEGKVLHWFVIESPIRGFKYKQ